MLRRKLSRRDFGALVGQLSIGAYATTSSRSMFAADPTEDRLLPNVTSGVACGDVAVDSATIWSRSDRASRMIIEVAADESFRNPRKVIGPEVLESTDFTGKVRLYGLKPGQDNFYRVSFQDFDDLRKFSAPVMGRVRTAPSDQRDVKFVWSGDTAGQGYGIDKSRGGMTTFEAMRKLQPDFFVNSGDVCYADNPISSEVKLDDGSTWVNVVTEGKSKVAETLQEYRDNYLYNLMDANVRALNAEVPLFAQWDDHEVLNNWYPGEILEDDRYQVKSVSLLAARARQAFLEYMPIRNVGDGYSRIYRNIPYGPHLELFFLDMRSYRAANSPNQQTEQGEDTKFLGNQQIQWLKKSLKQSQATWKVICSDMPLGIIVRDGKSDFENSCNGNGPALGRELEIADLLKYIKDQSIKNTLWITADVHYAASHYYDPSKAQFQDFEPFWEFVSGPLHAGTFGPGEMDNTFGPEVKFKSIPEGMKANRPPSEGFQFFGSVKIDGQTKVLTVEHFNSRGEKLWGIDLPPA